MTTILKCHLYITITGISTQMQTNVVKLDSRLEKLMFTYTSLIIKPQPIKTRTKLV